MSQKIVKWMFLLASVAAPSVSLAEPGGAPKTLSGPHHPHRVRHHAPRPTKHAPRVEHPRQK